MPRDRDTGRPTLMLVTPGVTQPDLAAEPLATEAEATAGSPEDNPWRSVEERERVKEARRREDELQDSHAFKTETASLETLTLPHGGPLSENDPFAFDDLDSVDSFNLPPDPLEMGGPQF